MNSPSKPPEALVFFLDRSLGKKRVATALRQAGATLEIHDDHLAECVYRIEFIRDSTFMNREQRDLVDGTD